MHSGRSIPRRSVKCFETIYKVSSFLTREIIGKRRQNYCGFFKQFVKNIIASLSSCAAYINDLEKKLSFLKDHLKWRFAVPFRDWHLEIQNKDTMTVCILDETISNIIHPQGLTVSPVVMKMVTMALNRECYKRFRQACEKLLFRGKYEGTN